ncbi:MAG TPA: diguanylate cyclase [Gemmataceae bacterium]|nr:diguanylate cyclase [Gemmataceae bacterium]
MSEPIQRRRVLFAATEPARAECRPLFHAESLRDWEVIDADSLERARFLLQLDPCDVLVLDCSLYRSGGSEDLSWLAGQRRAPVLVLDDGDAETVADALRQGAHYWMPRELARHHAPVLAAMLRQAAEFGDLQRRGQETSEALEDTRRQVSRLVNLLWEAVPGEGRARWFTQRHMLERLEEEVIRTQRYGGPLAVLLGEVDAPATARNVRGEVGQAATWIVDQISRVKRRSDVAGQYGLQGFMLLLPQTNETGATGCCQRLRSLLEQSAVNSSSFGPLHVHFGIACFSSAARSVKSLLSRAEEQLEQRKLAASTMNN